MKYTVDGMTMYTKKEREVSVGAKLTFAILILIALVGAGYLEKYFLNI